MPKTILDRITKWHKVLHEVVIDCNQIIEKVNFLNREFQLMYAAIKELQDDKARANTAGSE